jgi:hypothetical protein
MVVVGKFNTDEYDSVVDDDGEYDVDIANDYADVDANDDDAFVADDHAD